MNKQINKIKAATLGDIFGCWYCLLIKINQAATHNRQGYPY